MVAIKTLYTLLGANQNSIYIEPVRAKTLYTLASVNQNSIYIEPFLSHNDIVRSA